MSAARNETRNDGNPPDVGALMLNLRDAAGHLVRCAQQRHTALWTAEFGGDITGPQYAVLSAVGAHPGLDQQALGQLASLDKSSTADVVARLHRQRWLIHGRAPTDARRKTLTLTPLARTALGELTRKAACVQEALLGPLDEHVRAAFVSALQCVAYQGPPPQPEPVTAPVLALHTTPGHLLRRAQQVHTQLWAEEVGRPMTSPQYAVLSGLHTAGAIDQGTAGELASLDKSSVADVVRRLTQRGWISGEPDPADRRRRVLTLTDAARTDMARLAPAVRRVQVRLLAPLDAAAAQAFMDGCRTLAFARA